MEIVEIKMYYDVYEKYFGDGFFPYIKENNYELEIQNNLNICKIIFNFKYDSNEHAWIQITEDAIYGLDGDTGETLLKQLNNQINVDGNIIKNKYNIIIFSRDEK